MSALREIIEALGREEVPRPARLENITLENFKGLAGVYTLGIKLGLRKRDARGGPLSDELADRFIDDGIGGLIGLLKTPIEFDE